METGSFPTCFLRLLLLRTSLTLLFVSTIRVQCHCGSKKILLIDAFRCFLFFCFSANFLVGIYLFTRRVSYQILPHILFFLSSSRFRFFNTYVAFEISSLRSVDGISLLSLFLLLFKIFSFFILNSFLKVIETFEGSNHLDDIWMTQICHDLHLMHLAFSIVLVFEFLLL